MYAASFHHSASQFLTSGRARRASSRFCSVSPGPPGATNSLTAWVVASNSLLDSSGCTDLRYRLAVSSSVGTGSRGSESSNRSMAPLLRSSL